MRRRNVIGKCKRARKKKKKDEQKHSLQGIEENSAKKARLRPQRQERNMEH